jgi:hypothetical protein
MGGLRTLAVAVVALWALGAQCAPAGADGPIGNPDDPYRYTPYNPAPSFPAANWVLHLVASSEASPAPVADRFWIRSLNQPGVPELASRFIRHLAVAAP